MTALAVRQEVESGWRDEIVPIPAAFALASGDVLDDGRVVVRLYGRAGAPVVAVLGGISAGRCVAGDGGWWNESVGYGAAIDLDRYTVLGLDFAPLNDRRVRITPDDQARLIELALDHLGIERLYAFVGSSYGGMIGFALAARAPQRVERLCVISAADKPCALGLAWRGVQRRIVEYGLANGDGAGGLALARQLAMTTYRSSTEFDERFGVGVDEQGLGEVDRYLIARGEAYPRVMAPSRWLSLSESIDRHNVAPERVHVPTTLVACPTDQLAPFEDLQELAGKLPRLEAFHTLPSIFGHDAFLKETEQLRPILTRALETTHG